MKKFLFTAVLILIAAPSYAAEQRRELPGNAVIVTNPDRPTPGVLLYNGDESIYYRALVGRHRHNDFYSRTPSATGVLQAECAKDNRTTTSRNACMRRAMREYEHGIND